MAAKKPIRKVPIEKLQEDHLLGPAQESISEIANKMLGKVEVTEHVPELEKIIFRNQRDPGYPLDFHYASKTHPFKMYTLIDGKEYTLPKEVIRNLEGCKEHVHKYRRNIDGIPEIYNAGFKQHFVCERAA